MPRVIRLRDAPLYLGMDRNRFNAEVRPFVSEVRIGRQGIAFDRLELDAWWEHYKSRNERRPKASVLEDDKCQKPTKCRGLRQKGGIWHIEKRCQAAPGGWLRESTGTSSRREAEKRLIRRLAEIEEEVERHDNAEYLFEEAGLRYLSEVAHKASADDIAYHLDQLFPFIGKLPLAQVHNGTVQPFIDHELARGLAPKSINNVLTIVGTVLNRSAKLWRDEHGRPWLSQAPATISRLSVKGRQARSYPLSWREQDALIRLMPRHLADAVLFAITPGVASKRSVSFVGRGKLRFRIWRRRCLSCRHT